MALTSQQVRKCLTILCPTPSDSKADTGSGVPGWVEKEARAVLAAVDADQEALIAPILTAWDNAWLDESSIDAQATNKGFSTSGKRARKLIREQLVGVLGYEPQPNRHSGYQIGRA